MKQGETKRTTFKRLATKRANRVVKNLSLLGNLSNKHNYIYTKSDIRSIFNAIEEEFHLAKSRFAIALKKEIKIKI